MKIVKIGNVELTLDDAMRLYTDKKYIVTYSKIYQLNYSRNAGVYGHLILDHKPGMTRRGRFFAMSAADINRLLGYRLVNEVV